MAFINFEDEESAKKVLNYEHKHIINKKPIFIRPFYGGKTYNFSQKDGIKKVYTQNDTFSSGQKVNQSFSVR